MCTRDEYLKKSSTDIYSLMTVARLLKLRQTDVLWKIKVTCVMFATGMSLNSDYNLHETQLSLVHTSWSSASVFLLLLLSKGLCNIIFGSVF